MNDYEDETSRRGFLTTGLAAVAAAVTAGCRTPSPHEPKARLLPPIGINSPRTHAESVYEKAARFKTLHPTESIPEFVMCPPTKLRKMNTQTEVKHWEWLTQTISGLGGKVSAMKGNEPDTGYGEVWTRDPVLAFPEEKIFFMGTYPPSGALDFNRKIGAEAEVIAKKLEAMNFKKIQLPHPIVDGGEVIVDTKKRTVFIGYDGDIDSDRNRNRWATAKAINQATGYRIIKVQRDRSSTQLAKDADFYHLDCGMGKLPDGKYLVSESAVTPRSMQELKDVLRDNLVVIKDKSGTLASRLGKNALGMAYNFICVGKTMVMPYCSPELTDILEGRVDTEIGNRYARLDYTVVTPEKLRLPEGCWKFSNGSVHCTTQQTSEKINLDWTEIDKQIRR